MKQSSHIGLVIAVLGVLLSVGCATQPGTVAVGSVADLPQTLLSGAKIEHARAVAMGAARSKGWDIADAAPNQLMLERELPRDAPQAVALGVNNGLSPPRIQVETNFVERPDGTLVALRSFIIANPGSDEQEKIDYTESYESDLQRSLASLQAAWAASRDMVVAQTAVPRSAPDVPEAGPSTAPATPAVQAFAEVVKEQEQDQERKAKGGPATSATGDALTSATPRPQAASPDIATGLPPVEDRSVVAATAAPAAPPAVATPPVTVEPSAKNEMLVLSTPTRKGLWAYYAEDYARTRGCSVADVGAVLLTETPDFELHEVYCNGSPNVLLRCQGGVCNEMH